MTTLRQQLLRVKDTTPTLQTSNVVYSIPCGTCSDVYIGQTGHLLEARIDEHKAAVKHARVDESAVAEHVWIHKDQMDFQSVSILARERNLYQHLTLESWLSVRAFIASLWISPPR
jgi:predicted GIY-YIG superfamily endonuclease